MTSNSNSETENMSLIATRREKIRDSNKCDFSTSAKHRNPLSVLALKRREFFGLLKIICLIFVLLLPRISLAQSDAENLSVDQQQPAAIAMRLPPTDKVHQEQMDANLSSSSSYVISDPGPATAAQPTAVGPPPLLSPMSGVTTSPISGTGSSMPLNDAPALAAALMDDVPLLEEPPQSVEPSTSTKRRQYIPPGAGAIAPSFGVPGGFPGGLAFAPPGGPPPPASVCPSGGPSLPVECDPKRPWPQCPPQSYCYATNTVDIGPYFCCPIWSTYGAAWRPATPFYNYAPPPPPNWPDVMRLAAQWPAGAVGMPLLRKSKKEPRFVDEEAAAAPPSEDQQKIVSVMNDWIERQEHLDVEAGQSTGEHATDATIPQTTGSN